MVRVIDRKIFSFMFIYLGVSDSFVLNTKVYDTKQNLKNRVHFKLSLLPLSP